MEDRIELQNPCSIQDLADWLDKVAFRSTLDMPHNVADNIQRIEKQLANTLENVLEISFTDWKPDVTKYMILNHILKENDSMIIILLNLLAMPKVLRRNVLVDFEKESFKANNSEQGNKEVLAYVFDVLRIPQERRDITDAQNIQWLLNYLENHEHPAAHVAFIILKESK